MTGQLTIVGDTLLDRDVHGTVERIAPDAPVPVVDEQRVENRPGGAGLAAVLAAADGREVVLVTALADDDAGRELERLLAAAQVEVVDLHAGGRSVEKVRIFGSGRPVVRLDRGGVTGLGPVSARAVAAVARADAVLVSDYGQGTSAHAGLRATLQAAAGRLPFAWDPHPRGLAPVPGVRLATPNRNEVERAVPDVTGHRLAAVTACTVALLRRWQAAGVAVTLGDRGALLVEGDAHPLVVPATPAEGGDACGAGDRFAAAVAGLLADGALPSEAVIGAVAAASRFVAAGGARSVRIGQAAPHASGPTDAETVVAATRARGGTVVATGGCFDLLHAGHVAMLQAARALGDCLVVCLNSDASVRRLKGPHRPLMGQDDRAAVLLALGCVDAVAVFDEDSPTAVVGRLRPDVWAKGADYAVADLPEAAVVREWGGQVVVLPYLEGRSTSRLLEEVRNRGR